MRLRGMFNKRADQEFAAELEMHLQMHIDDNLRKGMTAEQARRDALIRLGGLEQTRQVYRERQGLPLLETLGQDIRFALRQLGKSPGFAMVAILTLALGIGANTALFSVVNGVLLNPLPYPHPEELVTAHASKPNFSEGSISYPNFRDWQRGNKTLAALAVTRGTGFRLTGLGDTEEVSAQLVSSDFFPILGVKPVAGRLFAPDEDQIGRGRVVLISEGFWKRKFGSNPDAVGRALRLDDFDYTIVGVLPANFHLTIDRFRSCDLYVPIGQFLNPALTDRGAGLGIHGIARLKPGVTLAQAQADMAQVSQQLAKAYPRENNGISAKLVSFKHAMVRNVQPLLLVLMGAVAFVLLIACVNIANLLLARSNARAQEFAVRSALGAGRMRLVRQLLTESILLSFTGGILGLLMASLGTRVILRLIPQEIPRATEIHISTAVLCFTLLLSLASGILFGLVPAWKASRNNVQDALKEGQSRTGTHHRTQDWLVVLQMATALVLLSGAGLMIRSMIKLTEIDPGFQPQGVLTFGFQPPSSIQDPGPNGVRAYLREANRRISTTPGIEAVSFSWAALPMMSEDDQLFWLDGEPKPANENNMHWALRYIVDPGYLKAMRIPLLKGRFLAPMDDEHGQRAVVIDDIFARKFFGNEDPIGKRVHLENHDDPAIVVGVVGHVNQWGLDSDALNPLRSEIYQAILQLPEQQLGLVMSGMDVVVRSRTDAASTLRSIENTVKQMNHEQIIYNPETMEDVIADTLAPRRFAMILLAVFAGTALLLASIGIYGVISYLVGQRAREIGIRMALGASRRDVFRWIVIRGGRLALIGIGIGIPAALLLTRLLMPSYMIYGVRAYDPFTLLAVTAVLIVVALVACCLPARRATRVDPMQVLRTE
jgi:predicted permease